MKKNNSNITALSEGLVKLISTSKGQEKLIDAFKNAQKAYRGFNPFFSWVCMESRNAQLDDTISILKRASSLQRLEEVKKFISTGGWESNSANTLVLQNLIKAVNPNEQVCDLIQLKEKLLNGLQQEIRLLNQISEMGETKSKASYDTFMGAKRAYSDLIQYKKAQQIEKENRENKAKEYKYHLDQLLFGNESTEVYVVRVLK